MSRKVGLLAKRKAKQQQSRATQEPWVVETQRDVARFFGWGEHNLTRYRREGFPGSRRNYDLSMIYRWLESRKKNEPVDDPLNQYRIEKAKLAALNRLEREGALVHLDELQPIMSRLASMLKQCAEQLERTFGADAREAIEDVLDDFEREMFP